MRLLFPAYDLVNYRFSSSFLFLIPLPHSSSSFLFLLQVFLEGSPTYDVACDIRANPLPRPHMITWRSRAEGFDPLSPIRGRVINKRDFSMRAVADVRPFMQAAALRSHSFRCVREWKFCPVIYEQLENMRVASEKREREKRE